MMRERSLRQTGYHTHCLRPVWVMREGMSGKERMWKGGGGRAQLLLQVGGEGGVVQQKLLLQDQLLLQLLE